MIVSLPTIGGLTWQCDRKRGTLNFKFSTTFAADLAGATETVSYSLDGNPWVTGTLQPGDAASTPFRSATSHSWRIVQPRKPYTTEVTIEATFTGNSFGDCLNPEVQVSRVRLDHGPP
jgi:hypothetical protein